MTSKQEYSTTPLKPAEPAAGFEVFTVDGLPVGTVTEIAGGFMRIDAPLRPDFWLRLDDATSVEERAITLAYPREALDQHRHSGPAPSQDDYMPAGAEPVLLDEEERQKQRELMERELEEQRRRLAERTPGATEAGAGTEESRRAWPCSGATCARCVGAVVAMAAVVLGLRMWRRRRRRETASDSPIP